MSTIPFTDAISKETSYEPASLSDFTLHFKDHSYRVHAVILCKESHYFRAAVTAARTNDACSLSKTCLDAGHRCLTLPDTLGGSDFSLDDMTDFLMHLYDGSLLLSQYSNSEISIDKTYRITFAHQPAPNPYGYAQQPVCGSFTVGNNNLNVAYASGYTGAATCSVKLNGTGNGVTGFTTVAGIHSAGEDRLSSFLNDHAQTVKLSHCFQCNSMLRYEEECCERLLREADRCGHYDSLWRLLVLSESCQWSLISDIIKAVSKDRQFKTRGCWSDVSKSLTSGTFAQLLELMVV